MKKYLVVFISVLLFISGCMNTPTQVTGPKWINKSTIPLVMRVKNPDGSTNTEFRLDGLPNGVNETGPDLTGDGSAAYAPGGDIVIDAGAIGCIETAALSQPIPGTGTVNFDNQQISFVNTAIFSDISDYTGFRTSSLTNNGTETVNTISIQIVNGLAGAGGLTFQVDDNLGADIRQNVMNQGSNTVNITLTDFELINGIRVSVSGVCNFNAGGGEITVAVSKLQISAMTIKGAALSAFPYNPITINDTYDFDMQGIVDSSVYISNCDLTFSIANMPDNLKIDADFIVEGFDSNNIKLFEETHTPLSFQNSSQTITIPFDKNLSRLKFTFQQVSFDAVDPTQDVTIDGTQSLIFTVRPHLSLQSEVQEIDVQAIDQSLIRNIALNLSVNNNTQLGLAVKLYLSSEPDPINAAQKVIFEFAVNPATIPGQALETRINSLSLTAQQIADLTGNQKIYNQFEITDLSTGKVQDTPYPFLEIRSSATLEILVNNQ